MDIITPNTLQKRSEDSHFHAIQECICQSIAVMQSQKIFRQITFQHSGSLTKEEAQRLKTTFAQKGWLAKIGNNGGLGHLTLTDITLSPLHS